MNCDLAFDLMTDPAGCGSQALQSHLADCPRCRQMQETLAPALDWLGESGDEQDSDPLPPSLQGFQATGVRAPAAIEALEIARESAKALSARTAAARVRYLPTVGTVVRSAALIALGGLAAFVFVPDSRPAIPNAADRDCYRHDAAAAASRSPVELKLLVATCAACHEPSGRLRQRDRRAGALNSGTSWRYADTREDFQKLWLMVVSDVTLALEENEATTDHAHRLCPKTHFCPISPEVAQKVGCERATAEPAV